MSNFSSYLENALLGATLLGSPFTELTTTYIALATSINSDGDSFTEVTTNIGYERQPMVSGVDWSDITSTPDTTLANSVTKTFSPATTPWGVVAHFGVYDAATIGGGNLLYWGDLPTTRDVQTDDVVQVVSGNLTVRLT